MDVYSKLSKAIQINTITSKVEENSPNVFHEYHQLMENLFPEVHKTCNRKIINGYSLVYHWKGNSDKKPIIMTAHFDVVPIEEATIDQWVHPPFSGEITDEYIWGRGALDTKVTMISALEAAEQLIKNGYIPSRDIYFAFGHDEEVGGATGAKEIVAYFQQENIDFDYLIDEGGCVTLDSVKEVDLPVAVIGIAEKGYLDIEISAKTSPGHSSTPPRRTSVGIVTEAISNLERHQLPMDLTAVKGFFKELAPHMKGMNRLIVGNLWLFGRMFKRIFSKTSQGNALLRTTTAPTVLKGSMKANVLPEEASGIINFRIASHQTIQDVIEHIEMVNRHLPIKIKVLVGYNPSKVSDAKAEGFLLMKKTIERIFEPVIVAPYLTLARTDASHYESVAAHMYRFAPYAVTKEDLGRIHGVNERISKENVDKGVAFYKGIYENC